MKTPKNHISLKKNLKIFSHNYKDGANAKKRLIKIVMEENTSFKPKEEKTERNNEYLITLLNT